MTNNENEFEITKINEITESTDDAEPVTENTEGAPVKKEKSMISEAFEWIQAIAVALVVAMFLRTFVLTLVNVDGRSMQPTLQHNERLMVWRLGYEPKVGDIIVFRPRSNPNAHYIKRVIATEGQTVDIRKSGDICEVYVDGVMLEEDYISEKISISRAGNHNYPVTVPQDHVFVMGDNRNNSTDSRMKSVDVVSEDSIVGKAMFRFWPLNKMGGVN